MSWTHPATAASSRPSRSRPGSCRPASAWAVVAIAAGLGVGLSIPSGAATVGLADRRPRHRLRLRPGLQGHGLVVVAVRHRDPVAAGLRLAGDHGRAARTRSRSCSPSPSSPAPRWPSPTPGPMPSATPRPAWSRSRPGWASSGRGPSTRHCWPSSSAWRSGRWWLAPHRRPPCSLAVGAGMVVGLGVAIGRRADSARRERAWELEAVGVGLLAAAWLAGTTLGQ